MHKHPVLYANIKHRKQGMKNKNLATNSDWVLTSCEYLSPWPAEKYYPFRRLRWYMQLWFTVHISMYTVKPVLSGHSKRRPKIGFQTHLSLNAGQSIAECSKGSILQYYWPSLSYHLSLRSLFCLFLSGRLRQVLLYVHFASTWHNKKLSERGSLDSNL